MNAPTGNITFLFTDIEGSTKLAQKYPGLYQESMERHHKILEDAINVNRGFIFEIVGDAFCAAFSSANDAIKASVSAQRNLVNEEWLIPEVKVRMGLNRGEASWCGERYTGYLTLARTNRIMSVAYGGQILLSKSVFESANKDGDFSFRDMGERKLKDLYNPEHIYQLLAPDLNTEFPALQTLDVRPNNLPLQLTSFIGREKEIAELKELLQSTRLITLTGPGGSGKTRLSLQVGVETIDELAHGVWFIELASVTDPQFIADTVAHSLPVTVNQGQTTEESLISYLRNRELLIILDNCEHLIQGCADTAVVILRNSTKVKLIASSREPLQIPGELVYPVPSLEMPHERMSMTAESALKYEAVRLFTERAILARSDFKLTDENADTITRLCREIDGIPLAIELAAARMRVMSAEQVLGKICDMFRILTGGSRTALPKHQTLRATIDWSYNLLSEKEKRLLRQLSVFSGCASSEAVDFVCSDEETDHFELLDLLTNLIDKSLVKCIHEKDTERYDMLQSIQLYAREKLEEEGESVKLMSAHFEFFLRLSLESRQAIIGPEQRSWLIKLNKESENIRHALKWAKKNDPVRALSMMISLGIFYSVTGNFLEGLDNISSILDAIEIKDKVLLGSAYMWKGFYLMHLGRFDDAIKFLTISVGLLKESGNQAELANSINYLGIVKLYKGELDEANELQEECLEIRTKLNDIRGVAASLNSLGLYALKKGEFEKSSDYLKQSIEIYKEVKDERSIAASLANLAKMNTSLCKYDEAFVEFKECLMISDELGDKYVIAHIIEGVATLFFRQGRLKDACSLFALSHSLFEIIGVELHGDELLAFERSLPVIKKELGEEVFDELWREAQSTEEEKIVEYAVAIMN